MKSRTLLLLLPMSLLFACNLPQSIQPDSRPSACGDGTCTGPETAQNCPADCATPQGQIPGSQDRRAPLFITTMTHMEGPFIDDRDENVFNLHIEQLTYGMDLADEYGAILTIESEQPFAIANVTWGRNFMAEIVARGHGVGTHCDFGFRDPVMPVEQYAAFFAENKALVDALVGPENNRGCSGGGSANDWAIAASMAGFDYLDGIVSMHFLSMPLENRPGSEWTDEYIISGNHHFNAPVDLYQRIYLFEVADATDFVPDEDGVIVISSGELGAIALLAEGIGETGGEMARCPDCPLTTEDVDTLVALIREVDRNRDPDRVAKLAVYIPAADFIPENEMVLRYFFDQMQHLAEQGVITWASQLQVYNAYMEWDE